MYLLCEKVAGNVTRDMSGGGGGIVHKGCNILYVLSLRELNLLVIVQVQCRITVLVLLNKCQSTVILKSICP
jgi:hypothetical protein